MAEVYGGIEAGGTKFVCAVGTGPSDIQCETTFPTTTPEETLGRAVDFLREHPVDAVGVAAFGPIDLDPASATYGYVLPTPKPGWTHTPFAPTVSRELGVPVGFDTDTNVAALGERRWGAGQGLDNLLYLTIGTGIGGGGLMNGALLHGLLHPEMGHIRVPHDRSLDPFPGVCPFHGDCLEGLAAGPAIAARWGERAENLPIDHPAWELEAHYLALGLVSFILTLAPERVLMGGGVMSNAQLFPLIRRDVQSLLAGYLQAPQVVERIDEYIVPPGLGNRAGVLGAIALAQDVALEAEPEVLP